MKRKLVNKGRARPQAKSVRRVRNELLEDAQIVLVPNDGSEPYVLDPEELASVQGLGGDAFSEEDELLEPVVTGQEAGAVGHEMMIHGEIGCSPNTSQEIIGELQWAGDETDIVISLHSDGGDAFQAVAIYNALLNHSGHVTIRIDGLAASAASLIAMAGDTVIMPENTMMMIHKLNTDLVGDADDLRAAADMMDNMEDGIIAAYAAKSGHSEEEILDMMEMETWFSAADAVSAGFADVVEEAVRVEALRRSKVFAKFRNVPGKLRAQVSKKRAVKASSSRSVRAGQVRSVAKTVKASAKRDVTNTAQRIASLCYAAGKPNLANQYIDSGIDPEALRHTLIRGRRSGVSHVNNRARPIQNDSMTKGISSAEVYAKRKKQIRS